VKVKRRLPLAPSGDGGPEEDRPGWQWVGFGAFAIFVVWLPLSALSTAVAVRWARPSPDESSGQAGRAALALVASSALAIAIGAWAGGFVVGKWGGSRAGLRVAAFAGLTAAVVAVAVSWIAYGFDPASLIVIGIAVPFAALGGKRGLASR
jgi:hypothetical protein